MKYRYFFAFMSFLALISCREGELISSGGSGGGGSVVTNPGPGATPFVGVNLEVPIELVDYGVWSTTAGKIFNRTRTSLNTNDYDGTVNYVFEVVAKNADATGKNIWLVDSSGTQLSGTISVPAGTANFTRYRVNITPNTGADNYRVKLAGTAVNNQLQVHTARILVQQTNATKTKIYFPLAADVESSGTNGDTLTDFVDSTVSTIYSNNLQYFPFWKYVAADWATLDATAPFTFEALLATSGSATAFVSIFETPGSGGAQIASSALTTTLSSATPVSVDLSPGVFTDSKEYWLKIKSSTGAATTYLFHAGLWIKLTNLTKGEVYYRIGWSSNSASPYYSDHRFLYLASLFSNPTTFFELTYWLNNATSFTLRDDSSNDSGGPGTIVSTITTSTAGPIRVRNSVTLNSGSRYIYESNWTDYTHSVFVPVQFQQ